MKEKRGIGLLRRVIQALVMAVVIVAAPLLMLAALGFADSSFGALLIIILLIPEFTLFQLGLVSHSIPEKQAAVLGFLLYVAIFAALIFVYTRKEIASQTQEDRPDST